MGIGLGVLGGVSVGVTGQAELALTPLSIGAVFLFFKIVADILHEIALRFWMEGAGAPLVTAQSA